MVLDDPPAPAALAELGFATCEPVARLRTCAPGGTATALERLTGELGLDESDMLTIVVASWLANLKMGAHNRTRR